MEIYPGFLLADGWKRTYSCQHNSSYGKSDKGLYRVIATVSREPMGPVESTAGSLRIWWSICDCRIGPACWARLSTRPYLMSEAGPSRIWS